MGVVDDVVGSSTIQVDTGQVWLFGENLGYAGIKYNTAATNQHAALARARDAANTIMFGAALTKNAAGDITKEAFSSVVRINEEITRLQQERAVAVAGVNPSQFVGPDGVMPPDIDARLEAGRANVQVPYNDLITQLEGMKAPIITFLNGELSQYATKLDTMLGKANGIFAAFDSLNAYDAGHAYIVLRIAAAANTICKYSEDVENNSTNAEKDFLNSLPTVVPEGQTVDPNSDGAGWRETETILVGLAASGYLPPTLESGINEPFYNGPAQGQPNGSYPDTYDIANAYRDNGLYNTTGNTIQGWYDYYNQENPNGNYSDFVNFMTDLYDKDFPDSGSADMAQGLIDSINQYIAGDPTHRTVYSYFHYWWTP